MYVVRLSADTHSCMFLIKSLCCKKHLAVQVVPWSLERDMGDTMARTVGKSEMHCSPRHGVSDAVSSRGNTPGSYNEGIQSQNTSTHCTRGVYW